MRVSARFLLVAITLGTTHAWGQGASTAPHVGYVYPAGGRHGSVFRATVGGQFLRNVTSVHVSGEGVRATVIQHYRPLKNLNKQEREELMARLARRRAELTGKAPEAPQTQEGRPQESTGQLEHPLLADLEKKSLPELEHVWHMLLPPKNLKKKQINAQIAESVLIEVTIASDAAPGSRDLRLRTPAGLTNPICFQVGALTEFHELEPNDARGAGTTVNAGPFEPPITLNGQIMPGDIDRFAIRARRGQKLVIEAHARRLIPYLADAVPGWFQATLTLYDRKGREVAFVDDYLFSPDPIMLFKIPETGQYELEIRDAMFRGRQDFIYRIDVGERRFISGDVDLGGRVVADDVKGQKGAFNVMPQADEVEPNDSNKRAQTVTLPVIVSGRIAKARDVDVFRFKGHAGDDVVAEVYGRRLQSPIDSLIRVTDFAGTVLLLNDDYEQKQGHLNKDMGLFTHHADSHVSVRLPRDGWYYVQVADAQNRGGREYGYRLRISPPQPDFAVHVAPSSLNAPAGGTVSVTAHAIRKDGFQGQIDLTLADARSGFKLAGNHIPAGRDRVRFTITLPPRPLDEPVVLDLEGHAEIAGQTVARPVMASEDMMQAFLYRHLVPSGGLMIATTATRGRGLAMRLAGDKLVRLPAGGTADVQVTIPRIPWLRELDLILNEPPEGIRIEDVKVVQDGLVLRLKADGDSVQAPADNLIVDVFRKQEAGQNAEKAGRQARRISLGSLPAIPFEIVPR